MLLNQVEPKSPGLSRCVPGEVGSCFDWLDSWQHCVPSWMGRLGGRGSGRVDKSAATADSTAAGTVQVQGTAAVEGNTAPSPGSRRCPGWCPSPQRGLSRRGWLDFGCLTGSFPREEPAHCSRRGDLAGGEELVGRLGAPSPSASGAATVADQAQAQVQVAGCRCVQEQVLCCPGVQVGGSVGQVVGRGAPCRHSMLNLKVTA